MPLRIFWRRKPWRCASTCAAMPGGPCQDRAASLLDYLLPKGTLFIERDKRKEEVTESDGMCVQIPIVVLINTETYSEAGFSPPCFRNITGRFSWAASPPAAGQGRRSPSRWTTAAPSAFPQKPHTSHRTATTYARPAALFPIPSSITATLPRPAPPPAPPAAATARPAPQHDEQLMAALKYLS